MMSGYKSSEEAPIRFHGYCSYPNCRNKKIDRDRPFVHWMGVKFPIDEVHHHLSPQAKLMAVANPGKLLEKFGHYSINIELHPECAAEWAMHLTRDAFEADGGVVTKMGKQ
jgi:hypothetical protein